MAKTSDIFAWTLTKEGGLSRSKSDSASSYPAPCTITYNGVKASDWHTNKGITWETFETNAPKLGYKISCKLWAEMPNKLWAAIAKKSYWDFYDLDNMKSQAVANILFQSVWGSGASGSLKMWNKLFKTGFTKGWELRDYLNKKVAKDGEKTVFNRMWQYRLNWLLSLPNQQANYEGWKKRAESLYQLSIGKAPSSKSLNPYSDLGVMDLTIALGITWLGFQIGKKL